MFETARRCGSCVEMVRAAWREYQRDRAGYLGVAMIYYAMVSLAPFLALLISVLGLLLRFSAIAAEIEERAMIRLEATMGTKLPETITLLIETVQQQSIVGSAISLAGLLMTASVLFRHLRMSFRSIWKYDPPLVSGSMAAVVRTSISEWVVSVLLASGAGGVLVAAFALTVATEWMSRGAEHLPFLTRAVVWSLAALSSVALEAVAFALLLKFLPPLSIRWRFIRVTALLCAIAWWAASEALVLYGVYLGNNPSAYGAVGGLLAILLWMKVGSQVLFFGAELCKVAAMQAGGFPRLAGEQPI